MGQPAFTPQEKTELWALMMSVDYDYSRMVIADHDLDDEHLTLWLEDKDDFKNTAEECLRLDISLHKFGKIIKAENLNSYETVKVHQKKGFVYKTRVEISEPIKWYREDASLTEQQWAREAVVKTILTEVIESEVYSETLINH